MIRGPITNSCRVGQSTINCISDKVIELSYCLPKEFVRKGRRLKDVDRWKATEFRLFLLYTGPVILQKCLRKVMYDNFMLLFVGICCLTSPKLCVTHCDYARDLLKMFVTQFADLYGEEQLSYNVHSLVHLPADVKRYGPLDSFSCFPFESFLGKLKRLVRGQNRPLEQIIRRIGEFRESTSGHELAKNKKDSIRPVTVSDNDKDNCFLYDDSVIIIHEVSGELMYKKFLKKEDFF